MMNLKLKTKPSAYTVAAAMCEMRTLFSSRYVALAEGRNPAKAVKQCALRLSVRFPNYPSFSSLMASVAFAPEAKALESVISVETAMRKDGVL